MFTGGLGHEPEAKHQGFSEAQPLQRESPLLHDEAARQQGAENAGTAGSSFTDDLRTGGVDETKFCVVCLGDAISGDTPKIMIEQYMGEDLSLIHI